MGKKQEIIAEPFRVPAVHLYIYDNVTMEADVSIVTEATILYKSV